MIATALLLLAAAPAEPPLVERVDRIEINHVYDHDGGLILDQIILWDWNPAESRFDVVDWSILRDCRQEDAADCRRWQREHQDGPPYVGRFTPGDPLIVPVRGGGYLDFSHPTRRITAPILLETWTDHDREMFERAILPELSRRPLRGGSLRKPRGVRY